MIRLLVALGAALLLGCQTDLGPCDDAAAHAVVHDELGIPAYEGQALVRVACGNGSHCHAALAEGHERRGVPHGFDFDLAPLDDLTRVDDGDEARLRDGIASVRAHRHAIYRAVESGAMPPFGGASVDVYTNVPRYERANRARLPWVDSREGVAILRNWLSCGAPAVERTSGEPTIGGDLVPRR